MPLQTVHHLAVCATDTVTSRVKEIHMHWLGVFVIGLIVGLVG
jgi:hypothetical protein